MPDSGKLSKQADDYDHGYQISKAVSTITQRKESPKSCDITVSYPKSCRSCCTVSHKNVKHGNTINYATDV